MNSELILEAGICMCFLEHYQHTSYGVYNHRPGPLIQEVDLYWYQINAAILHTVILYLLPCVSTETLIP